MMRRFRFTILLVLAALVLVGCTVSGPFYGNIVGEVRSSRPDAPIPGALVRIANREVSTGEDGRFEVNNIPAKAHKITISHYYFKVLEDSVTIPASKTAIHTGTEAFRLEPREEPISFGTVKGEVRFSGTGDPVKQAKVSVGGQDTYTNESGKFTIGNILPGEYNLRVVHSDLEKDYVRQIEVRPNETLEFFGNYAIVVERWKPKTQTGAVEGYIYVRAGSQMAGLSLEEMEPLILAQSIPPHGYEPVTDAVVSVGGRTSFTEFDGYFHIDGLSPGTYTLTASGPSLRFDIIRENVRVYANQTTRFTGTSSLVGGIGYYIVIGIDDYPGQAIIPGTVANAEKVYGTLFDQNRLAGMGEKLINATKAEIKASIARAVKESTSEDDYLVIYFSGRSGKDYLSPSDDDQKDWSRAITDSELEEWVRPFQGSVTLIIDGRESNSMADGEIFKPQAFKKPYYTVISAAGPNQGVFYDPNLKSSVFTHFLVKGLSGTYPADLYRDGDITAYELFQYVYVEMDDYLWGDPDRHLPTYWGPDYRDSVIFRY